MCVPLSLAGHSFLPRAPLARIEAEFPIMNAVAAAWPDLRLDDAVNPYGGRPLSCAASAVLLRVLVMAPVAYTVTRGFV